MAKKDITILNPTPIHSEIKKNKKMISTDIDERHDAFCERYVDKSLPRDKWIPKEILFPTSDMSDVVNEVISQFPSDLTISGTQADFLKETLIEYSFLSEAMVKIWTECYLGVNGYLLAKPKLCPNGSITMKFDLEVVPSECVWEELDIITNQPKSITIQETKTIFMPDENVTKTLILQRKYTSDKVKTIVRDSSTLMPIEGYDDTTVDNPFKGIGLLPVIKFSGVSDSDGNPLATKLRSKQLELDNFNTNIQNIINLNSNPVWVISGTTRDWSDFALGAGQTVALEDGEDLKAVVANMQLSALTEGLKTFVDKIYKTAGLTPMSLRSKIYATDSARVAKMSSAELIGIIKNILNSTKMALDDLILMCLHVNGMKYTDEAFVIPQEILPIDLDAVFNTWAIGMNLGLVDAELFWKRYMPDLQEEEKIRIAEDFASRQAQNESDLMSTGTNVDNRAKIDTKPAGRKKRNTSVEKGDPKRDGHSTQK